MQAAITDSKAVSMKAYLILVSANIGQFALAGFGGTSLSLTDNSPWPFAFLGASLIVSLILTFSGITIGVRDHSETRLFTRWLLSSLLASVPLMITVPYIAFYSWGAICRCRF
jgi:hypothetical protein